MDIFKAQKRFVTNLEKGMFMELQRTIGAFNYVLKDYVTNKQLFQKGIDGDGVKLAGYARTTIRMKIGKGQPVDRTTTVDEGDFHASIEIKAFSDRFEVSSNVPHDKYIVKRYGRNILKLTDENIREFMIVYFLPNMKRYVNSKIAK